MRDVKWVALCKQLEGFPGIVFDNIGLMIQYSLTGMNAGIAILLFDVGITRILLSPHRHPMHRLRRRFQKDLWSIHPLSSFVMNIELSVRSASTRKIDTNNIWVR